MIWAEQAIQVLLTQYDFDTVLDIGCGSGEQSDLFWNQGKKVTSLDYGKSIYFSTNKNRANIIIGNFLDIDFKEQFDCVWCSHVLEHQLNVGLFLNKIYDITKEGGIVCITVPPMDHRILGGHVSYWNAGVLMYNLVHSGFNCRDARIKQYGYNISLIIRKQSIKLPELAYDNGDVNRIAEFLPTGLHEGFNGDIRELAW